VSNSILAFNQGGAAVYCYLNSATPQLACSDLFGNEYGDWVGTIEDQITKSGNLSEDPLFCSPGTGDFSIDASSPCAPSGAEGCGLIGAFDVGCGAITVESRTWSGIKELYR
jgi:hypothetical protein